MLGAAALSRKKEDFFVAVFYSFYYKGDSARVQQIIHMGLVEGQPVLTAQEWEAVEGQGDAAIQAWIDDQMKWKAAVVVLIGSNTANRKWVNYEITEAWDEKRPLVGIRINGLAPLHWAQESVGANPFASVALQNGGTVADYVPVYTPSGADSAEVYSSIAANLTTWASSGYRRP